MYENIKIETVEQECGLCEDYAKKHSKGISKIAILSCEGACSRGEVSRQAANLVAHKLSPENTVRICLGGAFTKNSGQRNLVRNACKVVAIEGCFINCSSRMMKGVLPELNPFVVQADSLYEADLPFGVNEISDEILKECAAKVAETIVNDYVNGDGSVNNGKSGCCSNKAAKPCWE